MIHDVTAHPHARFEILDGVRFQHIQTSFPCGAGAPIVAFLSDD